MEVMSMNELYHHGIKGMHWGVRRYQNLDGTLTDAGKRHANQLEGSLTDADVRKLTKKQRDWNAKNASRLSDEELTSQILRLQREKQLKQLTADVVRPGRKHVSDLLVRYGDQAVSAAIASAIGVGITKNLNRRLDKKFEPKFDFEKEVEKETNRVKVREEAQRRASEDGFWTKHYTAGKKILN